MISRRRGSAVGDFKNLRDDTCDRRVKFEQASLVENHRHAGRGDGFGHRGKIEDSRRPDVEIPALSQKVRQRRGSLRIRLL